MTKQSNTQIIIRHITGAKLNKIDPFALADTSEISFGRDVGQNVRFDDRRDDVVSRKHALLHVKRNGFLSFSIVDLNSSNGTFVNGDRISDETEILPEDTIEFGEGGPKFQFDVQPRPENIGPRTRVMNAFDTTVTRVVDATVIRATASASATQPGTGVADSAPKVSVGKNTVITLLAEERKKTSRVWMTGVGALIAFFVVGGTAIYWRLQKEAEAQGAKAAAEASSATAQQLKPVMQQIGMSPQEIVRKFGNSTVWINFSWRLFDKETGRPVFHKALALETARTLPAYFKLDGKLYPWFTTEDEEHRNYEMKVTGAGSGFVVSDQGFILTNKHVGAGWMTLLAPDDYLGRYGVHDAYVITLGKKRAWYDIVPIRNLPSEIKQWVPAEDPTVLFNSRGDVMQGSLHGGAMATPSNNANLFGKNELLEVRFPGNDGSVNATTVRQSPQADAALLKIESPQALTPVELAAEDAVKVGERVTVLGYPGISMSTVMQQSSNEAGQAKARVEVIPEPTVTEGIISKLGAELTQTGTTLVTATLGDAFQLGINTTGAGNSGGPVFNSSGKVVGLFTYRNCDGTTCVTDAVPIKYGRNLLNPQRVQ